MLMRFSFILLLLLQSHAWALTIGSKRFTESYILAEIIAQLAEEAGVESIERRFGLGGTGITYGALIEGEIALYPEYTGTIEQAILRSSDRLSLEEIAQRLSILNLKMSPSLGFDNSYSLALKRDDYERLGIKTISDLKNHQDLRLGLSHEFIRRDDGLRGLERFYGFSFSNVTAMEHSLAYDALVANRIDIVVVYSTDAKIKTFDLVLLEDDREFFPRYESVLLYSPEIPQQYPVFWIKLEEQLFGKINEETMRELNSLAEIDRLSFTRIVEIYLDRESEHLEKSTSRILNLTQEHLALVGISLLLSILVGIPLGIFAASRPFIGQVVLVGTGLLQTVPSLALLCFLIPVMGIGKPPAIIALFLYGLLPIVRNTTVSFSQVPKEMLETADLMGMSSWQKLRFVQFPQAMAMILSGIKTSAVINVGTATLAAFIGAGGLGHMIVMGLALNDNQMILQGAIPAAVLAVLIHFLFELIDRLAIPQALRVK
jgi:osmoprotectant transport system permease protein